MRTHLLDRGHTTPGGPEGGSVSGGSGEGAPEVRLEALPVDELILDPVLNLRDRLDDETIERYADAWDRLPPVSVFEIEGRWVLADGFHRHAAATLLAKRTIPSAIRTGTHAEALEFAANANLFHGLPLSRVERARAIEIQVTARHDWSDRKLAERLGVSRDTVAKTRRRLADAGRIPSAGMRLGADGKLYPAALAKDPALEGLPKGGPSARDDDSERAGKIERGRWDDAELNAADRGGKRKAGGGRGAEDAAALGGTKGTVGVEVGGRPMAPWEGPDQFATARRPDEVFDYESRTGESAAAGVSSQTVVVENASQVLELIAKQVREIHNWLLDPGFAAEYREAEDGARRRFREAIEGLAARAAELEAEAEAGD